MKSEYFSNFTRKDYKDILKGHQIERWIENIINFCIDIGEIILASNKKLIPQYYKDIFVELGLLPQFKDKGIEKIIPWIKLRNILAHEYLDIRWNRIEDFLKNSETVILDFIKSAKGFI